MGDFISDVTGDDERVALEALRGHLAAALAEAEPRYKGPLARQLRDVLAQIRDLPAPVKDGVDELEQRRGARRAGVPDSAGGKVVGRTGSD